MSKKRIDVLFIRLCNELDLCKAGRHYQLQYSDKIYNILTSDKYEPFWNGAILQHMYDIIIAYVTDYAKCMRALLHKYVINIDIIVNNHNMITIIYTADDINIIKKYSDVDQVKISNAILEQENYYYMNINLIIYILHLCDYTITQWTRYNASITKSNNLDTSIKIIKDHIKKLILYDKSLRNKWIIACVI